MVRLSETSRTKTNQTTNHQSRSDPKAEKLSEITQSVARSRPRNYIKIMKFTDLIIARDRLDIEIQKNAAKNEYSLTLNLAGQLESFAGAWAKHILQCPTNDKPFVDILTPLCKEEIMKNPELAGLFAAEQILHGAHVLRLAAIVATLKRVTAGEFVLEDEGTPDTNPIQTKKPAPLL